MSIRQPIVLLGITVGYGYSLGYADSYFITADSVDLTSDGCNLFSVSSKFWQRISINPFLGIAFLKDAAGQLHQRTARLANLQTGL